jgi:hypothetical protein
MLTCQFDFTSIAEIFFICGNSYQDLHDKYVYDLDLPRWKPDWLEQETLDQLRTDLEARQLIDAEWETLRCVVAVF